MRKSNDIIFYSLLALCLFTNCLFIGYYYYQQNREVLLGQELEHQKKQNYELIVNQIESGIIPHVISDKKEFAGYFVLVFPNGICEVCNKWLFKQISELSSTSDLVVVVPDKLKKNMEIYNTVYKLKLSSIFCSEKYAMPHTRVYLDLINDGKWVAFSLKNISENPLNISPEELTERFTRGDESRSTEGSGLGLSIAKDLTEIQQGTFEIYLDGDLFKVTVSFPTASETAES